MLLLLSLQHSRLPLPTMSTLFRTVKSNVARNMNKRSDSISSTTEVQGNRKSPRYIRKCSGSNQKESSTNEILTITGKNCSLGIRHFFPMKYYDHFGLMNLTKSDGTKVYTDHECPKCKQTPCRFLLPLALSNYPHAYVSKAPTWLPEYESPAVEFSHGESQNRLIRFYAVMKSAGHVICTTETPNPDIPISEYSHLTLNDKRVLVSSYPIPNPGNLVEPLPPIKSGCHCCDSEPLESSKLRQEITFIDVDDLPVTHVSTLVSYPGSQMDTYYISENDENDVSMSDRDFEISSTDSFKGESSTSDHRYSNYKKPIEDSSSDSDDNHHNLAINQLKYSASSSISNSANFTTRDEALKMCDNFTIRV